MKEQLTREQILNATNEELNEWTAVYVMKWKRSDFHGGYYWSSEDNNEVYGIDEWSPSTDISAAWEAWKKVQRDHIHMSIHWMDSSYMAEIIETDSDDGYRYLGQVEAPSETEAIVKCALIAVLEVKP